MIQSNYHKPGPGLSEWISTILVLETRGTPSLNALPVFTNGMPAMLCRTAKGTGGFEMVSQLALFGKSIPPGALDTAEGETVVIYFFKPFYLASLFNVDAKTLKEGAVDIGTWSPHKYNALRSQLAYAVTAREKMDVLDNLIVQQYRENEKTVHIIQQATDHLMNCPGPATLPAFLGQLHLTERTFQRLFKKYVGVTPTQYRRICQFQVSFGQLHSQEFDKLSDLAFENGFADQSHFNRTFKAFTGTTPNGYLRHGLRGKDQ